MASIFLTGATGYVGGQVLLELTRHHPEYTIAALVRDANVAKGLSEKFPKLRTVVGSLDDSELIAQEASKASVVLNLASNKHMGGVKAIHEGLKKKESSSSVYWVQISGASLLGAEELASGDFIPGSPSDQVWDDLDGIDALRSLIRKFESRAVDNYLLDVAKNTPHIKTAVVLPPIIYGRGEGPVHQVSVQIPALSRVALEKGHAVRVGRGLSRWGNVHVKDIARLFTLLAVAGVEGNNDDKIWGENGLYLPGIGKEINWAEISDRVAQAAKDQGAIKSTDVEELNKAAADTTLPAGSVFFGSNARSKSRRGVELLGWKASEEGLDVEIPRAVAEEIENRKGSKI